MGLDKNFENCIWKLMRDELANTLGFLLYDRVVMDGDVTLLVEIK